MLRCAIAVLLLVAACLPGFGQLAEDRPSPILERVLASPTDLWGDLALQSPNGPSYEFFEQLLPPLRYVNADFLHYPIVLSAPFNPIKARLVGNGSAINARCMLNTWRDFGEPVHFLVGRDAQAFGKNLSQLTGPKPAEGWIPVFTCSYNVEGCSVVQECFAATDNAAANGAVYVKFSLVGGAKLDPELDLYAKLTDSAWEFRQGNLVDPNGDIWIRSDNQWNWDEAGHQLVAKLCKGRAACLVVYTAPLKDAHSQLTEAEYATQLEICHASWKNVLASAAMIQIPEQVVQNAWRSLIATNASIANEGAMNYSTGNLYDRLFCEECGAAVGTFDLFGMHDAARQLGDAILDYPQTDSLDFHNHANKLQFINRHYWLTRGGEFTESYVARANALAEIIVKSLSPADGLLPEEAYCGDIGVRVRSLNSNANAWRAIRDWAVVLGDRNQMPASQQLLERAEEFRGAIMKAVSASEQKEIKPLFIPVALFGAEQPYEFLTGSMRGSYWNLMIPYVLRSGIFDRDPERESAIARYQQERGGLCMGLVRFDQHSGLFANEKAVDDSYSAGYVDYLFRTDQPDRALVSFYGKLAQGLTRDTFVGAEGTGLIPIDKYGRAMYLPPNSTSQAFFLWMLRQLLLQDFDEDCDGKPDTLRMLFATPRSWLCDGCRLYLDGLPTAFGKASVSIKSSLDSGTVTCQVAIPPQAPQHVLLRLRLPEGYRPQRTVIGRHELVFVDDVLDLTGFAGQIEFVVEVSRE